MAVYIVLDPKGVPLNRIEWDGGTDYDPEAVFGPGVTLQLEPEGSFNTAAPADREAGDAEA